MTIDRFSGWRKTVGQSGIRIDAWRFWALSIAVLGAVAAGSTIVGMVFYEKNIFPSETVRSAFKTLQKAKAGEKVVVYGHYFPIDVISTNIPEGRVGDGGGLTEFGDQTLLVTHDGRFFTMDIDRKVTQLDVVAPDNGFHDYVAYAGLEKNKDRANRTDMLRYNDVLYFKEGGHSALLVTYTEFDGEHECMTNTVAKLVLEAGYVPGNDLTAAPEDWTILFQTSPCLVASERPHWPFFPEMSGDRMAFRAPGELILTSGDFHRDGNYSNEIAAPDMTKQYGKVLSIDIETGASKILSSGHRNMQGVAIDDAGQIWVSEHGPRGGDELNLIKPGEFYGWPLETYGTLYNLGPWPGQRANGRHETYQEPVFSWVPSIAVSALSKVQNFHDAWDGDMVVSTLLTQSIVRLRIRDDRVVFAEPIGVDVRGRYVLSHSNGTIVIWSDSNTLLTLTPGADSYVDHSTDQYLSALALPASVERNVRAIMDSCQTCHSLHPNDNSNAPNLANVFNRRIASTEFDAYSASLSGMGGRWTRKRLEAFLQDPSAFAPGTNMPETGLVDDETLDALIDLLEIRNVPDLGLLE
ncbi:MAG: PQQ-dependent sugar dehydrogenase [Alphaproteobacteria bacterium]|nr:PQQ-dependent sugar dehydrogenase [Alphaproteobacteria bacterium]MBU2083272.1 PQQ-dependent sugar dehydrogenase [Alphaproteobacteria bacterium]MBU2143763.1 PQQ-dependent sugar dehydrogenase [Alphaproteobacteria bacterium]MBU2195556.1 PQQ-dependent sugar dehydrogenase [Alphaproteobacteria bacterium]